MADTFYEDGMDVLYALADIGDDASLSNLPVSVLPVGASLIDADIDTVEVEVGQLSVALFAEINAAVVAKGEDIHQHSVVRIIDPIGVGLLSNNCIDDICLERSSELPHIGWIDVAVQYARHIGAMADGNELAA